MKKIIRTATVPLSLDLFCRGLLHDLSEEYEVIAVSSRLPELHRLARRERVRTIGVPMERGIAPLKDLRSLLDLIVVFRREKPDMVHSITPKAGLLSMLAAWITRVPVRVHTFTGLVFPYRKGYTHWLLRLTDRLTAACATHVIPEGEDIKNDLIRYRITRKPLRVLGNGNVRGVDLQYWQRTSDVLLRAKSVRKWFGISKESFVFVFVGRFDRDKGVRELVEAFSALLEDGFDVHLLMVGAEEEGGNPLEESVHYRLMVSDRIHLSDAWIEDVRPWYVAADALVHSSYREGFPNVVLEAGAMGLPAIVTDVNGSREIIREGENGVIVPSCDVGALYQAMKRFVTDPELVQRMTEVARKQIADRYEINYVRQCLMDFYHEVLK